jgi:hypothetical protein
MKRVPIDNPIEIWEVQSNPKPIQIGETIGSDNHEASTPHVGSPGGVSAQPKIERTSGRESAPNPLHDLIMIYDDEESLEVSLVTPVQITEETKPEKAYSPFLDAKIQILP